MKVDSCCYSIRLLYCRRGQGRRLVNGCAQAGRRQPWAVARGGGELPTDAWGPPPLARLAGVAARTAAATPLAQGRPGHRPLVRCAQQLVVSPLPYLFPCQTWPTASLLRRQRQRQQYKTSNPLPVAPLPTPILLIQNIYLI